MIKLCNVEWFNREESLPCCVVFYMYQLERYRLYQSLEIVTSKAHVFQMLMVFLHTPQVSLEIHISLCFTYLKKHVGTCMSMSFLLCLSNAHRYLYIYSRSSADASVQVLSVTKCRMHGTNKGEVRCRQQQRMATVNLFSCLLMQGQRYLAAMVVQW